MKKNVSVTIFSILIFALSMTAQTNPIKIALKEASTTPPAYLLHELPNFGCPNVAIVSDAASADYLLEARGGDFEGPNGSAGPHPPRKPQPKASYTLYKGDVVVFGSTPIKEKNAVKDLCKYLLNPKTK